MTEAEKISIKLKANKLFGIDLVYYKTFTTSIIVFFAFVLCSMAVVYPKVQEFGNLSGQIASTKEKISTVQTKANYLSSVDQDELRKNEQLIGQAIPQTKDLYFLLNVVGEITRKHDFVVDSFAVSPGDVDTTGDDGEVVKTAATSTAKQSTKGINNVPLNVVVSGPSSNYLELIKSVERALPIMSIDRFSMESASGGVATLKMVISTYSLSQTIFVPKDGSLSELQLSKKELELLGDISNYTRVDVQSLTATPEGALGSGIGRADPFNF